MICLDTHILVHAVADQLDARENDLLLNSSWCISSIVLWELAMLFRKDRIDLDPSSGEFSGVLDEIHVFPLTMDVATLSTKLDFSGDPADEIIAATSVCHNVPLLTRDRVIRRSVLVPLA